MTPHVRTYISEAEVTLFEKIRLAVNVMPDLDFGIAHNGRQVPLSCHMLARAVARVFGLRFVDGFINPNYEHSWVLTPEGHIIDVYPIAVFGGPILLENKTGLSPWKTFYRKAPRNSYRGRFGKKEFRQAVNRIVKELTEVSHKLE